MTEPSPNRHRLLTALVLAVVLASGGWLARSFPESGLLRDSYDSLHQLGGNSVAALDEAGVAIVYLDVPSIQDSGRDSAAQLPRDIHARLVDRLTAAKARVVVFDVLFSEAAPDPTADAQLAAALRRNGRVILAADRNADSNYQTSGAQDWLRMTTLSRPHEALRDAAAGWGIADEPIEKDFAVRRQFSGNVEDDQPSLVWAVAKLLRLPGVDSSAAMADWNRRWVRYYGPPLTVPNVRFMDALEAKAVPDKFFRDKVVLIGARPMTESIRERHDEFKSPFSSITSRYPFMPGVEVHATQLLNLLRKDSLARLSPEKESALLVLAGIIFGFGLIYLRPVPATIVASLGCVVVVLCSVAGFERGVWFPWMIVAVVQLPGALGGSILFHSVEWYRARRRLEAARRIAEARIREQAALIDKAHDAILVQELDGRIRYANPSAIALFGWKDIDWRKPETVPNLFALDQAAADSAKAQALSDGEWNGELKLQGSGGRVLIVSSRWTLIRDEVGEPKELLVISSDITDQKQMEAQLLRTQRMETIGSLAGGMAHDLNNALSPILMGVQMLRRRGGDEESARILGLMEASTHRGAQMVRQVLLFARGREGEMERLPIAPLVRELEKMVRETFPRNISVEAFLPADLWPVRGNPTQLHQVLLNLCVNARDAMPEGGKITFLADNVSLEADEVAAFPGAKAGQYLSLTVTDTGSGMPPEVRARIFEPFFTTKGEGFGTGIGLSTVLRIVKNHGGGLRVESEPGQGTSFEILLPRSEDVVVAANEATAGPLPVGHGELILVADEERSIRDLVADGLQSQGYRVVAAADSLTALQLVAANRSELRLLICEIGLMGPGGQPLAKSVQAEHLDVSLIVTTGELIPNSAMAELAQARVRILKKPFALDELLQAVGSSLGTE